MKYIIQASNTDSLIKLIIKCIEQKKDEENKTIDTWKIIKKDKNESLIVHNTGQWENKGVIVLKKIPNDNENIIIDVSFHYWINCIEEERTEDDEKYLLGRFTELILVHFWNKIISVEIFKNNQ